jgi:cystine transport system substrate-binding protein
MKRTRISLIGLIAAAGLALAGCGSASTTPAGSAPAGGADNSLSDVKNAGVLKVGTEGTYSPFSFHDPKTNALTGYDVEVAKAVAAKLGVKVEYVETPWDSIFAGLGADRFDVVVNQVTKNPERAGLYGLSSTYTWSEGVVATRKGSDLVGAIDKALADLKADGTLAKISEKYFSADVSKQPAAAAS